MRNKRILIVLSLLAMIVLPLAAAQVTVDWNWVKNDPGVQYFRYQMDGEAEDGWTVVDASVTSYSASGLDGSRGYTLYLQQSYDGVYWSASAASSSQPVVPQEAVLDEPVVTEEVVETPEEEVVVEQAAPIGSTIAGIVVFAIIVYLLWAKDPFRQLAGKDEYDAEKEMKA